MLHDQLLFINFVHFISVGALVSAVALYYAGNGFKSSGDGQGYELIGEIALKNAVFIYLRFPFFALTDLYSGNYKPLYFFCIINYFPKSNQYCTYFFFLWLHILNKLSKTPLADFFFFYHLSYFNCYYTFLHFFMNANSFVD